MAESVVIGEADDGQRLDRWLKKNYPAFTFGQLQKILRTGQLRVDGKRAKGDARLAKGQIIRIPPQLLGPAPERKGMPQKDIDFIRSLVIYKDQHVIALNKPAGLAVQGGSKISKHIDGMLDGLKDDPEDEKPHLVHRLDRDTSGVLILARTTKAARELGEMFKGRGIRKYYWAVTSPAPELEQGKIQSHIAKVDAGGGERMMVVDEDEKEGRFAYTFYQTMDKVGDKLAWVAFWPRTGRQHQIRVHALQMGAPLLGDFKYEEQQLFLDENPNLPRVLHLHARRVIMQHPITGKKLDVTAPLDPEMKKTFKYFGFNAEDKSDPFEIVD